MNHINTALYRQIYTSIKNTIYEGVFKANDRLPSARAIAKEWGVARGTAEEAYQLLKDEGYIVAKGPLGCFIHPHIKPQDHPAIPPATLMTTPRDVNWGQPDILPFQMGLPALDAFPKGPWQRMTHRLLRNMPNETYRNAPRLGLLALRESIAQYLSVSRGIDCLANQVIITTGYRQTLSLIAHALGAEGSAWIEDPSYPLTRQLLTAMGFNPIPIPVDPEGIDIESGYKLAPNAKIAVVTPAHQSPLCCTLSLQRRRALLAWAQDAKAFIIEDDYDGEYRINGRPLPALKHLDQEDRVLYMGTFSKVLVPNLRLAYLVVPQAQVPRFNTTYTSFFDSQPTLTQKQVAEFMAEGRFARHIEAMRRLYKQRREHTVKGLLAVLGDYVTIDPQPGGMHIITRPKPGVTVMDDKQLAELCIQNGLYASALSSWCVNTEQQGLLMSYTNVSSSTALEEYANTLKTNVLGAR